MPVVSFRATLYHILRPQGVYVSSNKKSGDGYAFAAWLGVMPNMRLNTAAKCWGEENA